MELMFDWKQITSRGRGLTFNDVLLVPQRSDVRSRRQPELRTRLTKTLTLSTPFISANMDTVTEAPMAIAMAEQGGLGIIHRFMTISDQVREVNLLKESG